MEMLEHVPDPASVVRPARRWSSRAERCFLDHQPQSALVCAGHRGCRIRAGLLPRGTHEYARFIRPSELARFCREAGWSCSSSGLAYNPSRRYA
jgi:2-polyprenyl-6-hydroxyphenyl methylase/3-demethylubiquinone-9 3-methyltransferase